MTPDSRHAVSIEEDEAEVGTRRFWDLETGQELPTLDGHSDVEPSGSVTPDGRFEVSADGETPTLELRDVATGDVVSSFMAEEWITACGISPDGQTVVAGEYFGRIHVLTLAGLDQAAAHN